jgi:hypothetical protein
MQIEMTGEVPFEEVERRVGDALGPHYKVMRKSDSVIKVRRFPMVTENIRVRWQDDRTTLRALPGGVWIFSAINALSIHRRVRRSLSRVLVESH